LDIDIRTLSLVVVIANIFQAFAIAFLYFINKKYRGIGWWVLGSAITALGFFLLILRDFIDITLVTVILANTLVIAGSIFTYAGVMRFIDKREDLRIVVPVFVLFTGLYFYFTYADDNITIRTAIMSLFMAFYLFLTASALWGRVPCAITGSARFVAVVELVMGCFLVFRAGYVLFITPVETFFTSAIIQILSFVFFFGAGFLLTAGLIIIVNQRLNEDVVEAKEQFELFFRTSPDGIVISSLDDGVIVDVNEGFTNLTGFDRDDIIGFSSLELNLWKNPGDRQKLIDEVRNNGFSENYEIIFRKKDGSEITIIISVKAITLQGAPCIISVTRDITDRKRAEEALQQANRKLNLLSSITRHDILNTVTVLTGYLGLAREEPAGPKLKDYLDHLDASSKKIQRQIEFTREYQEIGVDAAAWQNVKDTVLEAASEFSMDGIALNMDCGNMEIFADPLLRKVFYNFFDNSFRYAPPFTTISVSCTEKEEGLSVVFADDGAGITEEVRRHLFERGFGKNTGLGLFLSREILAITGITISEIGETGKGARFEMTVPKGAYRFSGAGKDQV
jgi:PAS domain S-box-containing protein